MLTGLGMDADAQWPGRFSYTRKRDMNPETEQGVELRVAKVEKCLADIVGLLTESVALQKRISKVLCYKPGDAQGQDSPAPNADASEPSA